MADFNALEALINAHIKKNGVQAITGNILNGILRGMVAALGKGYTIAGSASPATDPGTMTGPLAYIAYTAGTYTHFGGLEVEQGEVAMLIYNEAEWHKEVLFSLAASATIDGNVGTPEVGVSFVDGQLTFDFRNMKGNPGDPAGFGTVNATVDDQIGTPSVSVQSSGPDTAKNFTFAFHNLKGETGVTSVVATVDNTSGTPSCAVSLQGQQLTLAFTGLKGAQGNTGVSADYPIAIINNLTTDDPASALSAAQGVVLDGKVSQLEAKVDDLSTGKYYGYFAQEEDLPEADVDGFAYVGEGPTYTIYNLRGGVWTSSDITVNQSPIGNDEDIDQNEDGKLQFANRVYNSLQPNGMGYKILRKDATFASQVTETNTIYEIRYNFNLNSATVVIPSGCVLKFNGGKLQNGTISTPYTLENLSVIHYGDGLVYKQNKVFQYTAKIEGLSENNFEDVFFDGAFDVKYVSYKFFSGYSADTNLLSAILGLAMTGEIPCTVDLEPGKVYEVTSTKTDYSDSIYEFTCIAHKRINGNGATIKDLRTRTFFNSALSYVAVIGLWKSNDVTINDLSYSNTTTDWPVGVVYDLNVTGAAFIHTYLDCDNINVDVSVYGARYGFVHGEYSNYWWCGENGLTHSNIRVRAGLTGYPLVVQIGQNLDLWVHSETDHRSAYIMGVIDAKIYVESKDHYSAPIACIIGDFRYSGEYGTTLYRGISGIDIDFVDLGTTQITGMRSDGTTYSPDTKCFGFDLWGVGGQLAGRSTAIDFKDIFVKINIPDGSVIGDFAMVRPDADPTYPQTTMADRYDNIHISVFSDRTNVGTPTRVTFSSTVIYTDVDFSINYPNLALNTAHYIYLINSSSNNLIVKDTYSKAYLYCDGDNIVFKDSVLGNVLKAPGASATPRLLCIKASGTFQSDVNVLSGKLTPVNIFPKTDEMSGAARGLMCVRTSSGLLLWNNGWYSIPLIPVTIDTTRRTSGMPSVGATSSRPSSPSSAQNGFPYFDTTLNKPIWQKGYGWIEADGQNAGIKRNGATTDRPTGMTSGFCYFDTTLGKPIWWNGTGWVDATGTAV